MTTLKRIFAVALLSCLALPAFATSGMINVNKASAHTLMTKLQGVNRTLSHRQLQGEARSFRWQLRPRLRQRREQEFLPGQQ